MSFENISAENRNMFNLQRCCSFCRRSGHRIINCDDIRLENFERLCRNMTTIGGMSVFRSYLMDKALSEPNLIKAFAIKKCGLTTRHQIDACIESIINYFYSENQQTEITSEMATQSEPLPETSTASQNPSVSELFDYMLFLHFIRDIIEYNEDEIEKIKFNITTNLINSDENLEEKCECGICYDSCEKINFIKLNCEHEFCKDCIKKSLQNERKQTLSCAFCRTDVSNFEIRDLSIKDELSEFI